MRISLYVGMLAVAAALPLTVQQATAQGQPQQCDKRAKVLGHLAQKYREAPVAVGVTNSGGLVEVLTTGDGNTWTIIVSNPNGMSCLVAAGEGWRRPSVREYPQPKEPATQVY